MGTDLDDFPVLENGNPIGVENCCETMSNDDLGAVECFQLFVNLTLADVVQGGCGLIHDEQLGVLEQHSGDLDSLTLPTGKVGSKLGYHRVISHGELIDEIEEAEFSAELDDLVLGAVAPELQILENRPVVKMGFLRDIADR